MYKRKGRGKDKRRLREANKNIAYTTFHDPTCIELCILKIEFNVYYCMIHSLVRARPFAIFFHVKQSNKFRQNQYKVVTAKVLVVITKPFLAQPMISIINCLIL